MRALDWPIDGRNWPNREFSRFVAAAGVDWHVQILGEGPALLLLHGAGASTHSFRDLAPLLARSFSVVVPDLPGNGFSVERSPRRPTILAMSERLGALLSTLGITPAFAVGHSAGAAVLARMTLDRRLAPRRLISLNGALLPFPGAAGQLFPALAKLLFLNPVAPRFFSWRARNPRAVERLIESTGSTIDQRGLALYRTLLSASRHVDTTLSMMAHWDLETLARDLSRLDVPLSLFFADGDRAVPERVAYRVRDMVAGAECLAFAGYGHLMHEEAPGKIAEAIETAARAAK